tara:strand:+ start:152054 stop:152893 length:840 start_codon:yes stop_codon:yes gene_type:complete
MIIEKNKILRREQKKPIVYDIYYTPNGRKKPAIIFCHGYKGFKDWGAWHLVAESLANEGFFFVKFNFSHNGGTIDQPIDFPDLEAFAQNNFIKELDDLHDIINLISSEVYSREVSGDTINLIGHSRGSGIVIIEAEENERVKKVVTWAGVCDYKGFFQEGSDNFQEWRKSGRTYVENGRTKQQMPHDWQFYENFRANEDRLTIKRAVKNLSKPFLVVHGDEDPTINLEQARALHSWNSQSELKILTGADHVFGAAHPWDHNELPKHLKMAVNETIAFLQ